MKEEFTYKRVVDILNKIELQNPKINMCMDDLRSLSKSLESLYKETELICFVDFVYVGNIIIESLFNMDDALNFIIDRKRELSEFNKEHYVQLSVQELYLIGFIELDSFSKMVNEIREINNCDSAESTYGLISKYLLKNNLRVSS